jgi:uncharacterized membrane protein YhaH (DUF805 family)
MPQQALRPAGLHKQGAVVEHTLRFGIQKASEEMDNLSGRPMQLIFVLLVLLRCCGPCVPEKSVQTRRHDAYHYGIMLVLLLLPVLCRSFITWPYHYSDYNVMLEIILSNFFLTKTLFKPNFTHLILFYETGGIAPTGDLLN